MILAAALVPAVLSASGCAGPRSPVTYRAAPRAESPVVSFTFAPPYDGYAGEARSVRAEVSFNQKTPAATLRGWFEADTGSVTLGEAEIDENALGRMFINAAEFPVSRFEIERTEADSPGASAGVMHGVFLLKGRRVPTSVRFELERSDSAAGTTRLRADWSLAILRDFDIPGPGNGEEAGVVRLRASLELHPMHRPTR